jgi:hypothetical protein
MRSIRLNVAMSLVLLSLVEGLMLSVPAEARQVRVLGINTGSSWDYNIVSFLSCITFTEVAASEFPTVDLNDFDVLLVSETFQDESNTVPSQSTLDALNARKSDLEAWIMAGHGVVALSEPVGIGRFAWLPDAVRPTVGPPLIDDTLTIVAPTHPVMAGLTSTGLSRWGASSHGNFTSAAGLDVLVTNGGTRPVTLAGTFGSGRIVITSQDPDYHRTAGVAKRAQERFVQNAIDWVASVVSGRLDTIDPGVQKQVTLFAGNPGTSMITRTHGRGEYCFTGVEPGTYNILIESVTAP